MLAVSTTYRNTRASKTSRLALIPASKVKADRRTSKLLGSLRPPTPWGERQIAARKLGYMRCREAVPDLLVALSSDPFWMVRSSMIQALEKIGDPAAIPTLREVAERDSFQVVRSQAARTMANLAALDENHGTKAPASLISQAANGTHR